MNENKKLTIALIGCGWFCHAFVPLFRDHPNVEKVYVCDLIRSKAEYFSEKFGVPIIDTYEEALADPSINCIGNFTQRHLHGDIVKRALLAGKHVYSAVPMATTVEECREIVELIKETGLVYMMGETCYYYPCAMFCREAYAAGRFGKFNYGASQYYHHIDAISYGGRPNEGGMPPMFYPTHSTGMILSAVGSYVTRVTCFGYEPEDDEARFSYEGNEWHNTFSSQFALMKLANGGTARVSEARSFGWKCPSSYISALYGTEGGYEHSVNRHLLVERTWQKRGDPETVRLTDVSDYVNMGEMVAHKGDEDFASAVANGKYTAEFAEVQKKEAARLPKEYETLGNGHMCSHQFLIDDFCRAAYCGMQPVLNAWVAARYTIPGLCAVKSAQAGGAPIDVPDCGECPFPVLVATE